PPAATGQRLSPHHRPACARDLLLDLRLELLPPAHSWLGPHLGLPRRQTLRVIILTAALPMVLAFAGVAPSVAPSLTTTIASPLELVELVAASLAAALL